MPIHCWLVQAKPKAVPGGKWIPYTPAQVIARRAAWKAKHLVIVCALVGGIGPSAVLPPLPTRPSPSPIQPDYAPINPVLFQPPLLTLPPSPTWIKTGQLVHPVPVIEPPTIGLFVIGLIGLAIARRKRTI